MNEGPTNQSESSPIHGDCYSARERVWMEYGQQIRAILFAPFLRLLTSAKITPDHLTILSLVFGLAFGPLWLLQYPWSAILVLWLHVLIDGLDGPLARYQSVASPRGSFTDSFCDQVVIAIVTIALMLQPSYLSLIAGAIFLVVYTGVLAIAMVRNTLQIPYTWLVRPRFFLYLAIPMELLGVSKSVEVVVWFSNLVLGVKLASGFWKLRRRLDGPTENPR